jgi:hypothetical protein
MAGIDAPLLEKIQRRHPAAQPEIRSAIVADMGAGRGEAVEIGFAEPHPVAEGQARPEKSTKSAISPDALPGVLRLVVKDQQLVSGQR